jgi:integration host factor subunit alpha
MEAVFCIAAGLCRIDPLRRSRALQLRSGIDGFVSAVRTVPRTATTPFVTKRGTLTRSDLANAIHRKVGVPRAESAKYVDMMFEEIFERIIAHEDVKLSSFGAFLVRAKKERMGRNPKSGEAARISARLVVCFKPSKILRARINANDVSMASARSASLV